MAKRKKTHAEVLDEELNWLARCIDFRTAAFGLTGEQPAPTAKSPRWPVPPALTAAQATDPYARLVANLKLSANQRLALALAIAPYVQPIVLDRFFARSEHTTAMRTALGGAPAQVHRGVLPTWETFYFLRAGTDLSARLALRAEIPVGGGELYHGGLLDRGKVEAEEPEATMRLLPSAKLLEEVIFEGKGTGDLASERSPATPHVVRLQPEDLVLPPETKQGFNLLLDWVKTMREEEKLGRFAEPGLNVLFYGPPGTGKSLAAGILGQATGREVYRVDLSVITSKYIGETEKNLARVFDQGERYDRILFFDEADVLFGARVKAQDHKDRHGNHEVAYLLQRIETHPGLIILASNMVSGLDKAFARRFQLIIPFRKPRYAERLLIWQTYFAAAPVDEEVEKGNLWAELADRHEITASIVKNVLRLSQVLMLREKKKKITARHVTEAVAEELRKEKLI